jgi:hypothetical protein
VKSSQEISHNSVQLMSDFAETVLVSIMRGGCDECCVHTMYIYVDVDHHNGDHVWNGRWSQMGWSVSDVLSQRRLHGQQLVTEIHVASHWSFCTVFLKLPYLFYYADGWVP